MSEPSGGAAPGLVVRGARTHNLRGVDLTLPARLFIVYRRQRFRQVVARLRHDLRRGAAPLRRVAVGLRPPVPGADGEAGRRCHRGHLPGDRHPPEEQHPQPAIHGRDDDRDPRLPAAAVRAGRPHVLPPVRPGRGPRDGRSGRVATGRPAGRHPPADRVRDAGHDGAAVASRARPSPGEEGETRTPERTLVDNAGQREPGEGRRGQATRSR